MFIVIILVGITIGMISSFFGVGGGFITVPALLSIFVGIPHQIAVATSLSVIFINALINCIRFYRQGRIPNLKLISFMIIAVLIGAFLGSKLSSSISPELFKWIFVGTLVLTTINTIFKKSDPDKEFILHLNWPKICVATLFALMAGIFSGVTGLGGGVVLMPIFMMVLKVPFTWLPVYNNSIIVFGTLGGTITHLLSTAASYHFEFAPLNSFQYGNVNIGILGILLLGSFFSTKWAANIGPRVPHKVSKILFVTLLVATILKMTLFN
ncbi:MAG: sulfite exporter TauE/SafE family protein [Bacteriovoracaceae bacterium]|nr:sulfite exporter TauE/SafE family protein [Bacteriovoracaceae bacterium]